MITYFLEVSICWGVLYLFYFFFLSDSTFFKSNRWYLVGSLWVGLLLPLVVLPSWNSPEVSQFQEIYLAPITVGVETFEQQVITITPEQGMDYKPLLINMIYLLGVLFTSFLLFRGLGRIWHIFRSSPMEDKGHYILVKTQELHLPFSFFNFLFWSEQQTLEDGDDEKILKHELTHIQEGHSYDVIFLEVLCILFWWNPLIYFYRHSIRNIHEFLADAAVLKNTHKKQYGHLLLRQFQSGLTFALANNFIHSQLKKRIKMMTKTKSRQFMQLKYLLVLPLFIVLALLVSSKTGIANPLESETITQLLDSDPFDKDKFVASLKNILSDYDSKGSIADNNTTLTSYYQTVMEYISDYPDHTEAILNIQTKVAAAYGGLTAEKINTLATVKRFATGDFQGLKIKPMDQTKGSYADVDEMPRFPGCENLAQGERGGCSKRQLIEFMISNLKYPKAAKEAGVNGKVLVKFVVKSNGNIEDIKAMNDIGGGCAEAAVAVVAAMPNWIAGKKGGEAVDVEMTLPFTFQLPKEQSASDEIFKVVEEMPRFPGCEDQGLSGEELKLCHQKKMLEFIYQNIRYPKSAAKEGVEGVVVVQFVVNKEGRLEKEKIVRSVDPALDEEVLYMVELMNEMPEAWIPGRQRGKKVNVQFNLPIKFKLDSGIKESDEPRPIANTDLELEDFKLLPNPTDGLVSVSFHKSAEQNFELRILDNQGREILNRTIEKGLEYYIQEFDLSQNAKGVYNLNITDGKKSLTKSIILQ